MHCGAECWGVRLLVVACNTASASALDELRAQHPPLAGHRRHRAGRAAAVAASRSQHIAVIGTEGTIDGGAYQRAIHRLNPAARVTAAACSMFVAMAEEAGPRARSRRPSRGAIWIRSSMRRRARYPGAGVHSFSDAGDAIRAVLPPQVAIVDSAATTAAAVLRRSAAGAATASVPRERHGAVARDRRRRALRPGRQHVLRRDAACRRGRNHRPLGSLAAVSARDGTGNSDGPAIGVRPRVAAASPALPSAADVLAPPSVPPALRARRRFERPR